MAMSLFALQVSWLPALLIAVVPAVLSAGAAVLSAQSAQASKRSEVEAARLRDLDHRVSERRYDVYQPMIEALREMLDGKGASPSPKHQAELVAKLSSFSAWIGIFGSDDALRSFHNFMQGAYASAPAPILLRLYAEFVLAARRDMGDRDSTVTVAEILGMRINDLYSTDGPVWTATQGSLEEACQRLDWAMPWERAGGSVAKA